MVNFSRQPLRTFRYLSELSREEFVSMFMSTFVSTCAVLMHGRSAVNMHRCRRSGSARAQYGAALHGGAEVW